MIHKGCGGKLTVIESAQIRRGKNLSIHRIRKCCKCGEKIESIEPIPKADIDDDYKHRNYY